MLELQALNYKQIADYELRTNMDKLKFCKFTQTRNS